MTGFIKRVSKVSKSFLPCCQFLSLRVCGFAWIYQSWVFLFKDLHLVFVQLHIMKMSSAALGK